MNFNFKGSDYNDDMAGLKATIKTDRSDKTVSRQGTEEMEISIENWRYGVSLTFTNESGFQIILTDQLTHQSFPILKADGAMVDWIIHNLEPQDSLEPYTFGELFEDLFGDENDGII